MKRKTKNKLQFLAEYTKMHLTEWRQQYSEGIVGAHVGSKERKGTRLRYYSIVFHVLKKEENPVIKIPKYIQIKIPGEGLKKIPTDVIETGKFELFSIKLGDIIKKRSSGDYGTIGVFLKSQDRIYACSNMHVLAPDLLDRNETYYYRSIDRQYQTDIELNNEEGEVVYAFLEKAIYSGIDAAIARIQNPDLIKNQIPDHGTPIGYVNINWVNYKDKPVEMYGAKSGEKTGFIKNIGIEKYTETNNGYLADLIALKLESQRGDSGSPIFDDNLRIVGILVGGDSHYSYVIPIEKILDYFGLELLTKNITGG
jgi:hypothetical protein